MTDARRQQDKHQQLSQTQSSMHAGQKTSNKSPSKQSQTKGAIHAHQKTLINHHPNLFLDHLHIDISNNNKTICKCQKKK